MDFLLLFEAQQNLAVRGYLIGRVVLLSAISKCKKKTQDKQVQG
jgi:hypothetical protein